MWNIDMIWLIAKRDDENAAYQTFYKDRREPVSKRAAEAAPAAQE
jgi:hypothetical protein